MGTHLGQVSGKRGRQINNKEKGSEKNTASGMPASKGAGEAGVQGPSGESRPEDSDAAPGHPCHVLRSLGERTLERASE